MTKEKVKLSTSTNFVDPLPMVEISNFGNETGKSLRKGIEQTFGTWEIYRIFELNKKWIFCSVSDLI